MRTSQLVSNRILSWFGCFICVAVLAAAYVLEWTKGLEPCWLCVIQRFIFAILAILFFVAALLKSQFSVNKIILYSLTLLVAALGVAAAGWQVGLEMHPTAGSTGCGAGLRYLFEVLPFEEAVATILQGRDNCSEVTWRLLGLSIPTWSLITFVFLLLLPLWQIISGSRKK